MNSKSGAPERRDKPRGLNLSDLEKIRLSIPPGTLPPGIEIVTIFTDSGITVGYTDARQRPILKPLSDLQRLMGVAKIVGSSEAVGNRTRQGDIVKLIISRLTNAPNLGPASPKQIADTVALHEALSTTRSRFMRNVGTSNDDVKQTITNVIDCCDHALQAAAMHYATSGGVKKTLKEFAQEAGCPFWFFTRLCKADWIPDDPQVDLQEVLFPKNISNGVALRVEEWKDPEVLKNVVLLLGKSMVILRTIEGMDTLLDSTAADRGTRLEAQLNATSVPLVPPWTLMQNLIKKRKAKPPPTRDDELSLLGVAIYGLFNALVGNRPRQLTPFSFWGAIGAQTWTVDRFSSESHISQLIEAHENDGPGTLDRALDAGALTGQLIQAIYGVNSRTNFRYLVGGERPVPPPVRRADPRELAELFKYDRKVNRTTGGWELMISEDEMKKITEPVYALPEPRAKARRFPIGDAPPEQASQLLAALRPDPDDPSRDKLFCGLYGILTELFSSFLDHRVTMRAVQIVRAQMVRMKGEGMFFSSDALTGFGGELYAGDFTSDAFGDI